MDMGQLISGLVLHGAGSEPRAVVVTVGLTQPFSSSVHSMPLPPVADLLETGIDDVIWTPVPMATAGLSEEAGPSMAASVSSLTGEETVSLAEAAVRLKQLELDSASLSVPFNLNLNNQDDVVKLTEKRLNSAGSSSSPVLTPLRPPEDMKSNILKAQAEAALKISLEEHVVIGDKNTNLQEAAASVEMLAEDLMPSAPMMPLQILNGGQAPKAKPEELEMPTPPSLLAPLSDNLIDFSDPTPVLPPQPVQSKPMISPRWFVPAAAAPPTAIFTNGHLDPSAKTAAPLQPEREALTPALHPHLSSQTHNVIDTSIVAQTPKEHGTTHKGLITTEL